MYYDLYDVEFSSTVLSSDSVINVTLDFLPVYAPCDLLLNYDGFWGWDDFEFTQVIPDINDVYKIIYYINGKTITKNYSSSGVDSDYITINNNIGGDSVINSYGMDFYRKDGVIVKFTLNIPSEIIDLSDKFVKLDLLDTRIINRSGSYDLIAYIIGREPNYVIPITISNLE